ncbi:MAG: helix-turn-helix transcriptional regulator [Rhodospirillaceae bacterium]
MISSRQIRAARALLGWSQQDLADRAILSLNAVKRLEAEQSDPRVSTVVAIRATLENGGIEFLSPVGGHGEGVRMARDQVNPTIGLKTGNISGSRSH